MNAAGPRNSLDLNMKVFEEIVDNIRAICLKGPITVKSIAARLLLRKPQAKA